jgi:hypothetical protein
MYILGYYFYSFCLYFGGTVLIMSSSDIIPLNSKQVEVRMIGFSQLTLSYVQQKPNKHISIQTYYSSTMIPSGLRKLDNNHNS